MPVKIQRTSDSIVLTLPAEMNIYNIQRLIDKFNALEILSRSKATEEQVNELVAASKGNWSSVMKVKLAQTDEFKDLF